MKAKDIVTRKGNRRLSYNYVDIDLVVAKWSHMWVILDTESGLKPKIIKYITVTRTDTEIELSLSVKQSELIKWRLGLEVTPQNTHRHRQWRRPEDINKLINSAIMPKLKYTREHKVRLQYQAAYLFSTVEDKRVSSIAKTLGSDINMISDLISEWLKFPKKEKGLELISQSKNMDSYVDICVKDNINQYKSGKP